MCSAKCRTDLIEQLREVCVHVLHSHDGARLSALAVFHGTPKDRKAKVKSFKTFVPKICGEQVREGRITYSNSRLMRDRMSRKPAKYVASSMYGPKKTC